MEKQSLSFKELKAENAAKEAAEAAKAQDLAQETEEAVEEETLEAEVEETEEETDQEAQPEAAESTEQPIEAWMQGDDQPSNSADDKEFSSHDMASVRRKYKARLQEEKSEVEKLRAELEQLKTGGQQQQPQQPQINPSQLQAPTREQFDHLDDPDSAFMQAQISHQMATQAARMQAQQQQQQLLQRQEKHRAEVAEAYDKHLERAVKLAEKSNISPESYRSADEMFRRTIASVHPQAADEIAEGLIAYIGEGSEKLVYYLGRNSAKRAEFESLMRSDPTGFRATTFLGKLAGQLDAPQKKQSMAPRPGSKIKGDQQSGDKHKALRKKYESLYAKGNANEAFKIKREAKKAGADTKSW